MEKYTPTIAAETPNNANEIGIAENLQE